MSRAISAPKKSKSGVIWRMAITNYQDDTYRFVVYVLGPIGIAAWCSIATMFLATNFIEPLWFYIPFASISIVAKQRRWW
jgi:hypothetical protein